MISYYENLFRPWHYQSQINNSSSLRHLLYGLVQNTDIFYFFAIEETRKNKWQKTNESLEKPHNYITLNILYNHIL